MILKLLNYKHKYEYLNYENHIIIKMLKRKFLQKENNKKY